LKGDALMLRIWSANRTLLRSLEKLERLLKMPLASLPRNTLAEDVAIRAAVKLFEADGGTDNGKSDDGTDIPSVGLTAQIT
jgi:hypothetical protein